MKPCLLYTDSPRESGIQTSPHSLSVGSFAIRGATLLGEEVAPRMAKRPTDKGIFGLRDPFIAMYILFLEWKLLQIILK